MQIKRFEALDMQDAIRMVKAELGSEAVILSTKPIRRRGSFGLFTRPRVEVTAAREAPQTEVPRPRSKVRSQTSNLKPQASDLGMVRAELEALREEVRALRSLPDAAGSSKTEAVISCEVRDLKAMVRDLTRQQTREAVSAWPPEAQSWYRHLTAQGVDDQLAVQLLERARALAPSEDQTAWRRAVARALLGQARTAGPLLGRKGERKAALFVGPTGVGKTTTIAKVAAHHALKRRDRVVLVTLDTYRIAAVEQLRIYAGILGLPVEVVLSGSELKRAVDARRDADLMLIDTAGRSPRDEAQMEDLRSLHQQGLSLEIHLVLSATTRTEDLMDTIRRYQALPIDRLVITKLDEASAYGAIYNALIAADCPLSFFTTGQRVPEDLELATPERVAGLILGKTEEGGWRSVGMPQPSHPLRPSSALHG